MRLYAAFMKKCLLIAVLAMFFAGPRCLGAEEWGQRVAVTSTDLLIARPFTFAATIAGAAFWAVTLPISVPTKTHRDALDIMVKTPYRLTFERDLGYFSK
jgi:hypothetical protein